MNYEYTILNYARRCYYITTNGSILCIFIYYIVNLIDLIHIICIFGIFSQCLYLNLYSVDCTVVLLPVASNDPVCSLAEHTTTIYNGPFNVTFVAAASDLPQLPAVIIRVQRERFRPCRRHGVGSHDSTVLGHSRTRLFSINRHRLDLQNGWVSGYSLFFWYLY